MKKISNKLRNAFMHCTPDNLDEILDKCDNKGKEYIMKKEKVKDKEKNSSSWVKNLSFVVCGMFIAFVGIFTTYKLDQAKVDSIIEFDVNPSVELKINKNEKVLEATSLNDDGEAILKGMDLKDTDIDVAVNAIIGSMLKNGYISELQNSILVSVKNDDSVKGKELETRITKEINDLLVSSKIEGAIMTQTLDSNETGKDNTISVGKTKLINEIIAVNNTLKFEDLAKLNINELNVLKESQNVKTDKITSTGTASQKGYIGSDKAKDIALKDAGVSASNTYDVIVDFDSEDGYLVYEVDFKTKTKEYEYEINAKNGDIITKESEMNDEYNGELDKTTKPSNNSSSNNKPSSNSSSNSSSSTISKSEAKSIALKRAGVSSSSISNYRIELDSDDGVKVYEVSFRVGRVEYDVEINAKTGKVRDFDKEIEDDDFDDEDDD